MNDGRSNIKIQRAGQGIPYVRLELLPAADLERYADRNDRRELTGSCTTI